MGTSDGTVGSTTNLTGNGYPAWNLVVMGDGYQSGEMSKYHADVDEFVNELFATWPFDGLRRSIDVYRVDVTSTDSGPDDPNTGNCTGDGVVRRTYFDSTFCNGGIPRTLMGNVSTAVATAKKAVPTWKAVVVLVNTPKKGGQSDVANRVCFSSPVSLNDSAIHELGHAGFGLGDEYETLRGCDSKETDRNYHPSTLQHAYANVTVKKSPLKWSKFVTASPTPLMEHSDPCTECDTRANQLKDDTVGLFEGADSYHCGVFRPQYDCMMRTTGKPFCVVCQDRIINMVGRVPIGLIASLRTGWVLDAAGESSSGATVQQWPAHGGSNQKFLIEPVPDPKGGSRYRIRAAYTDLVLDVVGDSTSPGAPLQLWPWHGGENQRFFIWSFPADGYAAVQAVHSTLYLEVPDGPPSGGVALRQGNPTSTDNQRWLFLKTRSGWRRCRKCQGLFYAQLSNGYCPATGEHDPSGSYSYKTFRNNPKKLPSWDDDWRWCQRCQGLFRPGGYSRCPAPGGGTHDGSKSSVHSLPYNMPAGGAEHNWYHCEKCGGLFFGYGSSVCPLDHKAHDPGFLPNDYSLIQ